MSCWKSSARLRLRADGSEWAYSDCLLELSYWVDPLS